MANPVLFEGRTCLTEHVEQQEDLGAAITFYSESPTRDLEENAPEKVIAAKESSLLTEITFDNCYRTKIGDQRDDATSPVPLSVRRYMNIRLSAIAMPVGCCVRWPLE